MTTVDEQGRPQPPFAADEASTLTGFLDFQRATLAWKCEGLDAAGMNPAVAKSTMTLGGIMKHLALVEDGWFSRAFLNRDYQPPWDAVDWDADPAEVNARLRELWQRVELDPVTMLPVRAVWAPGLSPEEQEAKDAATEERTAQAYRDADGTWKVPA